MNDRCRVFAVSGEELFPCRWAKAKKLVKANVAESIYIDGIKSIKMLEPTRMFKPEEAIMNNANEDFVLPKILYHFEPDVFNIIVYELNENDKQNNSENCWYHTSTCPTFLVSKKMISDTSCEDWNFKKNFGYPFRTKLSGAISDFEYYKEYRIEELSKELDSLKKTTYPFFKN